MKGLLLKDFYNVGGQFKLYALYPILGAALSYTQESLIMMIFLSAMMIVSIPISSFSYDDMADFTPLALTLPVSRKQLVLAKFVLSFIITLFVIVSYLILAFIMLQVFGDAFFQTNFQEQVLACLAASFSANMINCIMIPMLYRFGTEKGRIFLFIIPFTIVGLSYLAAPLFAGLSESTVMTILNFFSDYGIYIAAVILFLVEVIGIGTSNRIMQKKEF